MRLVYVSQNRSFGELLRNTLARANIQVFISHEVDRVQNLFDNKIDFLLVELYLGKSSGVEFIYNLRRSVSLQNTNIWFTAYGETESSPRVKKACEMTKASRFFQQPFSPLELVDLIQDRVQKPKISVSPTALRMISQIWASKSSAILNSSAARLIFCKGALIREDPQNGLVDSLQQDFLQYSAVSNLQGGNWSETGKRIFSLVLDTPPTSWINTHRKMYPVPKGFDEAIEALGVSEKFKSRLYSGAALKQLKFKDHDMAKLFTLWRMGVVHFQQESLANKKQQKPQTEDVLLSSIARMRGSKNKVNEWLTGEYDRLKDATPFVILGIPENANNDLIKESIVRMRNRYQSILDDRTTDSDGKTMAKALVRIVEKASQDIFAIDSSDAPEHEKLFTIGKKLIEASNWGKATKALHKAHQMCIEDSSILAHYSWAMFNNSELDEETRQKDALENLLLSVHLDSANVDALVFLCRLYLALDDPQAALTPIRRAATLSPQAEIQDLRIEVEDILSKRTPT